MSIFIETLGLPLIAGLVLLSILAYLGIHVLLREIIFVDIAFAQIAAVGTITAHIFFDVEPGTLVSQLYSFLAVLVAALFFALVRRRIVQIPLEAIIGVSYAVAAASALFLVGIIPGGHLHVEEMLAGSILWATWSDIVECVIAFVIVGFCFLLFRDQFKRISVGYDGAEAAGLRVVWWDLLFYVLVGVVITLAVRIAGVVVVFTFLIIPATISALFSSRWGVRMVIAWLSGTVAVVAGLLFAQHLDFSVGPSIALFLGVILIAGALLRRLAAR